MIDPKDAAILAAAGVLSFVPGYLLMPRLIRSFTARGMVGVDMNKPDKPQVAEMGGVAVVLSFFVGVSFLVVADAVVGIGTSAEALVVLAGLIACLGAAFVGAVDDLFDLRQSRKALFPVFFALPLGVYAVDRAVHFPRGFEIDLGLFMIPTIAFMVSAGANAANMLEGFNGLGAGLGLIMAGALIAISVLTPHPGALIILVPFFGATVALFIFNKYPSKVFPGDTYTLFMGATLTTAAIIMGFKEVGALLFVPMIAEFFLKSRGRFRDETFGVPDADGRLRHKGPIASLTHVFMVGKGRKEREVVRSLWALEAIIALFVVTAVVV